MSLQQLLQILRARKKYLIGIFLFTVLTTVVVSLLLPNSYTATATVVVDVKSPDPIAGVVLPGLVAPGYMATQIDILQSNQVAVRAVKLLGLDKNPAAIEKWKEASEGEGTVEQYYAGLLSKKLDIKPSRESNVIDINFVGQDPQFSAAVANAFAKAFIDTTIDLRVEPARQYATWFDERLKGLRNNLEQAQNKLSAYQQEKGIVITDERLDNENTRLNELTGQLALAQSQRADASSRFKTGGGESSTDVLQNPLIQNLKAELARTEAKFGDVSKNLGVNHPQYQQLEAQLNSLKQELKTEMARVTTGVSNANRQGVQKEEEIKVAIDNQKKRLLELKSQRDELSVLLKDVENAQRAYEAVAQRVSQTALESESQQTNVLLLGTATPPTKPSGPKIVLNTILSIFLGGLLGLGAAFVRELMDRRIRDVEDLLVIDGVPVIGVLEPKAKLGEILWRVAPARGLAGPQRALLAHIDGE